MRIFAVDDERATLEMLHEAVRTAVPEAEILDFRRGRAALEAVTGQGIVPDVVFSDIRIAAGEDKVSVLIRDNLPPYNPLSGDEHETNRKIIEAFCPHMDYRNTFLQNVIIMEWKMKE